MVKTRRTVSALTLELKCNVHPLDGISNVYDTDNGIHSCTFGSD